MECDTNISKIKREKMMNFLEKLKEKNNDDEAIRAINEIENHLVEKKYGLVWEEHEEQVDKCLDNKIPLFEEIVDKKIRNTEKNEYDFLLEGDNLHSLILLEKTHKGKIKCIYIDPPYNRGSNDFIYNDNKVGKEDSYRHSKWLSFMKRRLEIAKNLMSEKSSVIFISIDENECHNLKILCDEIFGEKNYIGDFIRKTKSSTNDADSFFNLQHEYCLIYKKGSFKFNGVEKDMEKYTNPDNDPNGEWKSSDPSAKSGGPSTYFEIKNPYTSQIDLPPQGRFWAFSKTTMKKYIESGKIKFKKTIKKNERGFIFKSYKNQLKNTMKPVDSLIFTSNDFMNQVATKEINNLGIEFDYPKPMKFIEDLILYSTNSNDIILDFFAGTGTTGEAVIKANEEDNGNRKFILCTDNENNICERTTYIRLKRTLNDGNLKYFKTCWTERKPENVFLQPQLCKHIKEMIELENMIEIDNKKYILAINKGELNERVLNKENTDEIEEIWLNEEIVLNAEEYDKLKQFKFKYIPRSYFSNELREVGE